MKTLIKLAALGFLILFCLEAGRILEEKAILSNDLIRLHVVADSDSETDQAVKLQVKDSVTAYLRPIMDECRNQKEAFSYLQENLPEIEKIANEALVRCGQDSRACVTLLKEKFDTRNYDTFSLPAGIYNSLRIRIGEGKGHNWWCVVYPSLCVPQSREAFRETSDDMGCSDSLTGTLQQDGEIYEIRFFILDILGNLENFFHKE